MVSVSLGKLHGTDEYFLVCELENIPCSVILMNFVILLLDFRKKKSVKRREQSESILKYDEVGRLLPSCFYLLHLTRQRKLHDSHGGHQLGDPFPFQKVLQTNGILIHLLHKYKCNTFYETVLSETVTRQNLSQNVSYSSTDYSYGW